MIESLNSAPLFASSPIRNFNERYTIYTNLRYYYYYNNIINTNL